jgi:hypothetical protein
MVPNEKMTVKYNLGNSLTFNVSNELKVVLSQAEAVIHLESEVATDRSSGICRQGGNVIKLFFTSSLRASRPLASITLDTVLLRWGSQISSFMLNVVMLSVAASHLCFFLSGTFIPNLFFQGKYTSFLCEAFQPCLDNYQTNIIFSFVRLSNTI